VFDQTTHISKCLCNNGSCSYWLVVARVVSQNIIEFNIVDLISTLCLESATDEIVLIIAQLHLEVIKDRAESSLCDETRSATVFILEVWFQKQSSITHISSDSHETVVQLLLFFVIKNILRVKDAGSIERSQLLSRVLLKVFLGEDLVNAFAKIYVINSSGVIRQCEVFF